MPQAGVENPQGVRAVLDAIGPVLDGGLLCLGMVDGLIQINQSSKSTLTTGNQGSPNEETIEGETDRRILRV